MKRVLLSLLFLCLSSAGWCQAQDSVLQVIRQIITEDSLIRDEMRFNSDGIFMPIRGVIQTFTHRSFNDLPGPFRENNHRWEDYGAAATPLAAAWVMKMCGVESRSNFRRMATANALALGLTVGLSQTLRWTVTEERPDGLGSNSLPSFHSALAFMGATVLSREYGHISPWITIGGYTAATGTQLLRVGHNAHWMNDVFMGASIGVVSTHLAYFLTDQIIGRKGVRPMGLSPSELAQLRAWEWRPSGFRMVSGTETNGRKLNVADFAEPVAEGFDLTGVRLRTSASVTAGFEAEWFVTDYISLSAIGRYTMSQAKLEIPSGNVTAWGEQIRMYHGDVSAGWQFPLLVPGQSVAKGIRVGARTVWGIRYNEGTTFRRVTNKRQVGEELLCIKPGLHPAGGAGVVIDMLQSHNQAVGFSFDFIHTFGTQFLPNRWVISSSWKALF